MPDTYADVAMQLRHSIHREATWGERGEAALWSRQDASTTPAENRQRLRSQWRPVAPTNLRCQTASAPVLAADACGINRSAYGTRVSAASGAGLLQADKPSTPLLLSRIGLSTTYRAPWTGVWFRCPHTPAAVLEGHRWRAVLLSRRPRSDLHRDLIPWTRSRSSGRQRARVGRGPSSAHHAARRIGCRSVVVRKSRMSPGCHCRHGALPYKKAPPMSVSDMVVVRMLEVVVHQAMREKHAWWYEDKVIAVSVIDERHAP